MTVQRHSYLLKVSAGLLLVNIWACGPQEEKEDTALSTDGGESKIEANPALNDYLYSGCIAADPSASYQKELRRIIVMNNGSYEAETFGFESEDCKSGLVAIIRGEGTVSWMQNLEQNEAGVFSMDFTRTSLKIRVIQARELDHWNGILTAEPVCDGFKNKIGDNVETINMSCLAANGDYTLKPGTGWTEEVKSDAEMMSLTGLAFGHFPAMKAYDAGESSGEPVLMKPGSSFAEGEPYTVGVFSYSTITNNTYTLSTQLSGSWQACHEENLVTFTFSGSTWTQSAQVGMGADCSGSPAYTVTYAGTYSVPGGLDYVEGGYKINYANTSTKYTVHTSVALDGLFNGVTTGTTAFCSGYAFTLNAETSVNGKSCKPRPDIDDGYRTVGTMNLYDIILVRDNTITDSRFTADGQGSSDTNRPYFFNGDLVYKKL
jgi:hypothetical protein